MAISILVSTYATELFTQVLDEEGVDAGQLMGFGQDAAESNDDAENDVTTAATEEFIAAAAVPVATSTPPSEPVKVPPAPVSPAKEKQNESRNPTMPADEKALVEAGEALWQRAARIESNRQQMTIEEMTDHEAMNIDM